MLVLGYICREMRNYIFRLLLVLPGLAAIAAAQDTQIRLDSSVLRVPKGLRLTAERSLVIPIGPDSVLRMRGRSGTTRLGLQMSAARRSKRWGFHLNPSIAWTGYHFLQDSSKTFPTTVDTFSSERHLLTWVDVPAGLSFHFGRGQGPEAHPWVEVGIWAGYRIAGSYRARYTDSEGRVVNTRISRISEPQNFRGGGYLRVGYGDIALYVTNRITGVYTTGNGYPAMPVWEGGIIVRM